MPTSGRTRVYVPTTLPDLAVAHAAGELGSPGTAAHAVTATVREWYVTGDLEELEYSALLEAAEASLRLLAASPDAPRRRVVVAADVPDDVITPGGTFRSSVRLSRPLPMAAVVSAHVDEPDAVPVVMAAVEVIDAADAGDEDARFALDEVEACDLLWYDVTEIGHLG
ncbi:MAG: hypothetical protein GXX79_18435 [Actinomycetales bacterium]|nr:hypothetical protein [Actinomycetales bacterium]